MEAALRTAYEIVTGRPLPFAEPPRHAHRRPRRRQGSGGQDRRAACPNGRSWKGVTLQVAVAHGLGNARKVDRAVKAGEGQYHFIEVMTCPGGCIGGGGQPRLTTDEVRQARIAPSTRKTKARAAQVAREPRGAQALR